MPPGLPPANESCCLNKHPPASEHQDDDVNDFDYADDDADHDADDDADVDIDIEKETFRVARHSRNDEKKG